MLNIWSVGSGMLYGCFLSDRAVEEILIAVDTLGPFIEAPESAVTISDELALSKSEENLFFCLIWTFVYASEGDKKCVLDKVPLNTKVLKALHCYRERRGIQ